MAKRKAARATTSIVRVPSSQPQTIRIAVPRAAAPATRHKPKHRRSGKSKGGGRGTLMGPIIGGFVLGYIDKSGLAIPTIPILGRAGTIGVAAYFLNKSHPSELLRNISVAALSVAAYEYGRDGKIAGEEF